MAETIAATGTMPNNVADWASVIANAQTQDPAKLAAAVAQASSEAQFAALAQMFSTQTPVIVRTDQLQAFLRLILSDVLPNTQPDASAQQNVLQNNGNINVPTNVLTQAAASEVAAVLEQVVVDVESPLVQTTTTNAPSPSTPTNVVTAPSTPGATPQNPAVNSPATAVTTPQSNSVAATQSPVVNTPQIQLADTPSGSVPTPLTANSPTTNSNIANPATTTNAAVANAASVITNSSSTVLSATSQVAVPLQSPLTNVADNRAATTLRAAYNTQTAQDVVAPKLSQLLSAQTSTVFASALAGKPVPVSVAIVDPQRLLGDHTGQDAKAFLLGKEEQPFSVVVFQNIVPPSAVANRTLPAQIETALNLAIAKAFPDEVPTHVRVAQLNNGMLAIVYEPTHPGETLRAAPLLSNAGFALLAEPTRGGEQLLPRISLALNANANVENTKENSIGKSGNGGGVNGSNAAQNQAQNQSWNSALNGWYNAPGIGLKAHIPSAIALFVAGVVTSLFAFGTEHVGEYLIAAACVAGIAIAFSMWEKRDSEEEPWISKAMLAPWRILRPVLRYAASVVTGTGEPWAFFAHEQDWSEWSKRARLRMAVNEAQQRVSNFLFPPEFDAFSNLGIPANSTWDDVNAAFRIMAKRYHPDSAPDASPEMRDELNEQFHRIMSSYIVLRRRFRGR